MHEGGTVVTIVREPDEQIQRAFQLIDDLTPRPLRVVLPEAEAQWPFGREPRPRSLSYWRDTLRDFEQGMRWWDPATLRDFARQVYIVVIRDRMLPGEDAPIGRLGVLRFRLWVWRLRTRYAVAHALYRAYLKALPPSYWEHCDD